MTVFSTYQHSPYRYMDIRCPCGGHHLIERRDPLGSTTTLRCSDCGTEVMISDHLRAITGIATPQPAEINEMFCSEFRRRFYTNEEFRRRYRGVVDVNSGDVHTRDLHVVPEGYVAAFQSANGIEYIIRTANGWEPWEPPSPSAHRETETNEDDAREFQEYLGITEEEHQHLYQGRWDQEEEINTSTDEAEADVLTYSDVVETLNRIGLRLDEGYQWVNVDGAGSITEFLDGLRGTMYHWEYPQEEEMNSQEVAEEIHAMAEEEGLVQCMVPDFRGRVTPEQCLQCAASGEARCDYDYALLRYIFSNTEERPDIHVTDITGCLKKAYLGKTIKVSRYPYEGMVLALGQITHGFLEGTEDNIVQTEVPVEAMGLKGRVDKLQFVEGGVDVTDFKTTRWLKPSNLPYGSHEKQVSIYARMLREKGYRVKRAFVQYIDLSGPTKCRSCKVPVVPSENGYVCPSCGNYPSEAHLGAVLYEVDLEPADEIEEFIESRRDQLILALEMNSPPEAEPGWLCKYCPYAKSGDCEEGEEWTA